MTRSDALEQVRASLAQLARKVPGPYLVPRFLLDGGFATDLVDVGDPCRYFLGVIDEIIGHGCGLTTRGGLDGGDLVYLTFIRTFASLNGQIGTPLKQIAFLPHLRSRLGASVLISLPTGVIGNANRKGRLGSPFAVRNPFDLDNSLRDPLLAKVPAVTLYQALGEACEHLGMRMGSIVPTATLAIDSPLFRYFPEIGYWWLSHPAERLHASHAAAWSSAGGYSPPTIEAAAACRFLAAPPRNAVMPAVTEHGIFHCAKAPDGQVITLANAFPDVQPADPGSYTWEDVSPVRYTASLAPAPAGIRPAGAAGDLISAATLLMAAAIAWRYCELGERIMIIDVAPSVPDAVLETARLICSAWPQSLGSRLRALANGEFSGEDADRLLAELADMAGLHFTERLATDLHFVAEELWSFALPSASYSAVTGPITPCVSAHSREPLVFRESLRHHLAALAGPELGQHLPGLSNHDTNPPTLEMSRRMLLFYSFLPAGTPLIFSGSEWGFEVIINREFGFSAATRTRNDPPLADSSTALFNDDVCPWESLDCAAPPLHDLRQWIMDKLRDYNFSAEWLYCPFDGSCNDCLGYLRVSPDKATVIVVIWNFASVPQYAELCLSVTTDAMSWPPYVMAAEPGELALIPAETVAVLIGATNACASLTARGST